MNNSYSSAKVSESSTIRFESVGKREKFWFEDENQRRFMFKRNETPGEDWAEVLACNIAVFMNIPHATYEFAHLVDSDESEIARGVITESFVDPKQNLTLGNTFLLDRDPGYAATGGNYKVKRHTIDAISEVISKLQPPTGNESPSATEYYAAYLFLDVLIANQDRHHENWGVVQLDGINYLAPTYDHASSFARNVSDEEKENRLSTNDSGYGVETFAARAKSAINANDDRNRRLTTREALENFCQYNNITVEVWQNRLANISISQMSDMITGIPEDYMSEVTKVFTLNLLTINRNYLLDL